MSIFDKDLAMGGTLRNVVERGMFTYLNGQSVYTKTVAACESVQVSDEQWNGIVAVNYPEFDKESAWPLLPDGFLCNMGKIEYGMIFKDTVFELAQLPEVVLDGHIEILFKPYRLDWMGGDRQAPKGEGWIRDYEWWKLVKSSIQEGIENAINPKVHAQVIVRTAGDGYKSRIDGSLRNVFYITLKIYHHDDIGDIFWPYEEYERDRLGMLFNDNRAYISEVRRDVGTPVSITTRLELRYKQTK